VDGEPIAILRVGGLLAAVGHVEGRPAITAAHLARHDETVRRLALLVPALLPARFGECLPDAAALAESLAPRAGEIARALILVEGCVQMTLRVFGESGEPAASETEAPVEATTQGGPGTRYLAARRRAANPGLPEVAALRQSLRPLLRAERIERPSPGPAKGQLLATAHDLVLRENAGDYVRTVENATAALAGRRVNVSGPWPPYAFAPGVFGGAG
jgi:hypothetical protein